MIQPTQNMSHLFQPKTGAIVQTNAWIQINKRIKDTEVIVNFLPPIPCFQIKREKRETEIRNAWKFTQLGFFVVVHQVFY